MKEKLKETKEGKKLKRALKELNALKSDNAGRSEADRTAVWRKIQIFLGQNDELTTEYVVPLLTIT